MSLRRDLRRLLRAATKFLDAHRKRLKNNMVPQTGAGDGGKGADALGKALDGLHTDPTLTALETSPPHSYAGFDEPTAPKPPDAPAP